MLSSLYIYVMGGFALGPIVHARLFTLQNNVYMLSSHHVGQISR
jgi:hypothetical protein